MAVANHERVGKALDLLKEGLAPFVARELKADFSQGWLEKAKRSVSDSQAERTLVSELREVRNRWAHQQPFSSDDAYRALDSAARLMRDRG